MNPDTVDLCRQTAEAVLENMFFETLMAVPTYHATSPGGALRAEVRFTGSERGSLQVAADAVMARRLTANFLGEDQADISEEQIENTLRELANIYCGCLLSQARPEARLRIKPPEMVSRADEGREWVELPVETGLLAVSLQWEGRPE
ncbi:MAG: chemotaxis protein CheX [Bryobacterales bacterium]|nr:chemotaxis protein CheX [Bryobacterales bacterium]